MGVCCIDGESCTETSKASCDSADGVFAGPCVDCPGQNVAIIVEGDGSVFVHSIGPPTGCPDDGGKSVRSHEDCEGPPFYDVWVSQEKSAGPAVMCHNFGSPQTDPIPADFFGPGSDPFTEVICLESLPLGIPEFGDADTLIERLEDPFNRCEMALDTPRTIDVTVFALSLQNADPVTVTYNGGQDPETWDVVVDLSPEGQPVAPQSTLTATKKHCNGGTYTSTLFVQPRFTFTKIGEPETVAVLDTFDTGTDPITLDQPDPLWWVVDLDPNLGVQGDLCSDFHPAVIEAIQVTGCDCNSNAIRDLCELEDGVASDCNSNEIPDACDIAGGTSVDQNMDGIPDECPALQPLPEDSLHTACSLDSQCSHEAECEQGVCYAPKHRYVSIARNPAQVPGTARRVMLAPGGPVLGWVGTPRLAGGLIVADLSPSPVYASVDFIGPWPSVVHLMGCEIATNQRYLVQAIMIGHDIGDEGNYSPSIELHTPSTWGDVVSTCFNNQCRPPDGAVGIDDILAGISKFQGIDNAPLAWLDIDPSTDDNLPNQQVNIGDILASLDGFAGRPYPGDGPLGCAKSAHLATYADSGCLGMSAAAKFDICPEPGSVTFTPSPGQLDTLHEYVVYNCCPDYIRVKLEAVGSDLTFREVGFGGMCDCDCCFNVESTAVDLDPGEYHVSYCWDDSEFGPNYCVHEDVWIP